MAQPRVACQLIVFGERPRTDLRGVLRDVAQAGYAGFEGGGPGAMSAAQMKALLEELGLQLAGVHTGYEGLQDLEPTLSCMDALDCHLLMCSGVGDREGGLEAYERAAEVFSQVGRRCQERGIRFCYHNHSWGVSDATDKDSFPAWHSIWILYCSSTISSSTWTSSISTTRCLVSKLSSAFSNALSHITVVVTCDVPRHLRRHRAHRVCKMAHLVQIDGDSAGFAFPSEQDVPPVRRSFRLQFVTDVACLLRTAPS